MFRVTCGRYRGLSWLLRNSLRAPATAKPMAASQITSAPKPKAVRPIASLTFPERNPREPEKARSPGPKAIQPPIVPKDAKMATPIRYCVARSQNGAPTGNSPARLRIRKPEERRQCRQGKTPIQRRVRPIMAHADSAVPLVSEARLRRPIGNRGPRGPRCSRSGAFPLKRYAFVQPSEISDPCCKNSAVQLGNG